MSRWDETGQQVETVAYIYNGANQVACEDLDLSETCEQNEEWDYDDYGNLTDDGTNTYTYDAANRLISVTDGVSTSTFEYNGDGDRIAQTVDSVETTYLLDTAVGLTMVLSETTGEDTIYYLHGLGLVAESDGVSTDYFLNDGLGSVRQLTNAAATPLLAQTFDPYGNLYASAGVGQTAYGFTGEYTDASGLLYLRARYYNPAQGRFLNMDPSRQEMNPYLYSGANPVMFTDPSGLAYLGDPPEPQDDQSEVPPVVNTTIKFTAYLLTQLQNCASGTNPPVLDFYAGFLFQFWNDMTLQGAPINITFAAFPPPPHTRLGAIAAWVSGSPIGWDPAILEQGSPPFQTGREYGRHLSRTVGIVETAYGVLSLTVTLGGGQIVAFACGGASGGICFVLVELAVAGVSTTQVAVTAHGVGVLYFNSQNPVPGGRGGGGKVTRSQKVDLDPRVKKVADDIEDASGVSPSEPLEMETRVDGELLGDIDIEYRNAILEVKSGTRASGIGGQVQKLSSNAYLNPAGKPVIVYFRNRRGGRHVVNAITSNGGEVFFQGEFDQLVARLLELHP